MFWLDLLPAFLEQKDPNKQKTNQLKKTPTHSQGGEIILKSNWVARSIFTF